MQKSLDFIKEWHKEHLPASYDAYRKGLTSEAISQILAPISPSLPPALLTLYQWHDGLELNAEFFPGFTFFPLEEAFEEYTLILETTEQVKASAPDIEHLTLWQAGHWPVFGFQGDYYYIDLHSKNETVYFRLAEETQAFPWYSSLEKMMKTLAACLEIGAMHIDEDDIFSEEREAVQAIRVRLNDKVMVFESEEPLEPQKREGFENDDGTKTLKTWYSDDHFIEEHYNAEGYKTSQSESAQGEVLRRDFWHYLSKQEVEITSEHQMGMMTTKTFAHIDKDGQVHSRKMQTFVNDVMVSEQEFEIE